MGSIWLFYFVKAEGGKGAFVVGGFGPSGAYVRGLLSGGSRPGDYVRVSRPGDYVRGLRPTRSRPLCCRAWLTHKKLAPSQVCYHAEFVLLLRHYGDLPEKLTP